MKSIIGMIGMTTILSAFMGSIAFAGTLDLGIGESQWVGSTLVRCGGSGSSQQPRSYCECRNDEEYSRRGLPNYAYRLFKITEYADGRRNEIQLDMNIYLGGGDLCERALRLNSVCQE